MTTHTVPVPNNNPRPTTQLVGTVYYDADSQQTLMWDGNNWTQFASSHFVVPPVVGKPAESEIEKCPALATAWEEYLIIRRLAGI
jgi:hypothetical protein